MTVIQELHTAAAPPREPSKGGRERRSLGRPLGFFAVFVVVSALVLLPLTILVIASFGRDSARLPLEQDSLGWANYARVLSDSSTYSLLGNTLAFVAGSLVIGMGAAIVLGWLIERTDLPARNLFRFLIIVPMAIPGMIYAISWTSLLSPRAGWLNTVWRDLTGSTAETGPFDIYSLYGMALVQGIGLIPYAYLMIASSFATIDPTLEEAAKVSGSGFVRTVRTITAPLLMPALLAALIFHAIIVLETFEVPTTIGLAAGEPVLATQIFFSSRPQNGGLPDYGTASVLAIVLLVFAVALLMIYRRVTHRAEKFVTVTGKAWRPTRARLGRAKWPIAVVVAMFVCATVGLPVLMLLWNSLFSFYRQPSWGALEAASLDSYQGVLEFPGFASIVTNTVVLSVSAAIITLLLCLLVSWMVTRPPVGRRWSASLDVLSFLPLTIPGVVVGLALVFGYLRSPIYGTLLILILAFVTKFLAFGSRALIAAQMQISPHLEEQSYVSGASRARTVRLILAPLLTPTMVNVGFWVAIVALRELGMVLMLYTPETRVVSTLIWQFWSSGDTSLASAVGVLMFGVLAVLYSGGLLLTKRSRKKMGM